MCLQFDIAVRQNGMVEMVGYCAYDFIRVKQLGKRAYCSARDAKDDAATKKSLTGVAKVGSLVSRRQVCGRMQKTDEGAICRDQQEGKQAQCA